MKTGDKPGRLCGVLLGLALCLLWQPAVHAQTASTPDSTQAKLDTNVHLLLGETTLAKVTAALAKQTGLTIEAADYLQERQLIVQMDDLSARAALDALAELNDWQWEQTQSGSILLTRRRPHLAHMVAAIPRLMQAALPKDFRTYLDIRFPGDDLSKYINPLLREVDPISHQSRQSTFREKMMVGIAAPEQNRLLASLHPDELLKAPLPYKQMTPEQQTELLLALVARTLTETSDFFFYGDLLPHIANPASATLYMDKTMLMIVTALQDGSRYAETGMGISLSAH